MEDVAIRFAQTLGIATEQVWLAGKFKQQVLARSLLCYGSLHEPGERMTSLGQRPGISVAAVSKSVGRGAEIVAENEFKFRS
jgi:hypothetical protein